ncbi:MAG: type II toxin-antitoxin system RelE/ParE family toxin [Clostridiales bacterium]|nr:type II toxin-antitoxin system RelE/ParE family toxin [Clostridiales bacterium]
MQNKTCQLRYMPLFEQDLIAIADYIANVLQNEDAADRLIDDVEAAILKRSENPLAFEEYHSSKKRDYPYYQIYVRNYTIFYVVIGNIMEVRRLIYGKRDIDNIL